MPDEKRRIEPMYVYAVIALFAIAFAISGLADYSSITGFAAGAEGGTPAAAPPSQPEPPGEPSCQDKCGEPCWLVNSGEQPGTYESAQGKIGFRACDGLCYSIQQSSEELLCCSHSDCPSSEPICGNDGRCMVTA